MNNRRLKSRKKKKRDKSFLMKRLSRLKIESALIERSVQYTPKFHLQQYEFKEWKKETYLQNTNKKRKSLPESGPWRESLQQDRGQI